MAGCLPAILLLAAMTGQARAVDFGGNIRLGVASTGIDDSERTTGKPDVVSGKLVINAGGVETLDNGLDFSWGVEFENDSADAESDTFSNDKSWIAVEGGFGRLILGEHSDMAGWACGGTDVLLYGTAEGCSLGHNTSPADAIQYRGVAASVDLGFAVTLDSSGKSDGLAGARYSAGELVVGGQFIAAADDADFDGVAAGEVGLQVGGTYALGEIFLGLTLADNGAADDSRGADIGLQLPLLGGNLAVVLSVLEASDSDSLDILYSNSLSDNAYAGLELNLWENQDDGRITAFAGTTF